MQGMQVPKDKTRQGVLGRSALLYYRQHLYKWLIIVMTVKPEALYFTLFLDCEEYSQTLTIDNLSIIQRPPNTATSLVSLISFLAMPSTTY